MMKNCFDAVLAALRRAALVMMVSLVVAVTAGAQTALLERNWQFLADRTGTLNLSGLAGAEGWRSVRVGLSWNAQFEDLRDYMGVAWYRTRFDVARLDQGKRALLRFGAVDYFSEVFVNGKSVGTHEGGYTPFAFDITDSVKPGTNELAVRVIDPPMDEKENRARFPEMLYKEIPHGKQNWYVQTGGIWQAVWLDIKPQRYIERVHVTPHINGDCAIEVRLNGEAAPVKDHLATLRVTLRNPQGQSEFTIVKLTGSDNAHTLTARIKSPKKWSLSDPALYTADVALGLIQRKEWRVASPAGAGQIHEQALDAVQARFGFRTFEARDGKLYLNGEPFYMIAALDQDFYPETIYTPPSEAFVRDQMQKAKRLGLNMLRCHIKVPDPVYLKVADEVGLLVWYEIPSWNDFNHFSPKAAERGEKIFAEMVERDWNHPSIVIQSVINESWGADLKQAEQRKWLLAAFDRAKEKTAPLGRLIVDNSPCCGNFHLKSDLDDFHQYNSIPDNHEVWDTWVADLASRPKWTYSPHGDGERSGKEPLIVSEFGNWGLPQLPKALPWWFPRDFNGNPLTRPAGVFERFKEFKFDRLFADYSALAEESQWHQFASLKHEIEEMRRYNAIQGYVITEFTDINWEVNGLMDMWRNPKAYAAELAKIQQPDVILARFPARNVGSGRRVTFELLLSHFSNEDINGAWVSWHNESGNESRFQINRAIAPASVESLYPEVKQDLPLISVTAPVVDRPRRERVTIALRNRDGRFIALNSYDLFVYPTAKPAKDTALVFHDPTGSSAGLRQALAAAGYQVAANSGAGQQSVMIATKLDDRVSQHLEAGGRAIILANAKDALPATAALKVTPRNESNLDGNWVTNFNWVNRNAAPFNEVAFTSLLGFEAARVMPRFVIQGARGADYDDVLSGIFYGWLNNNAALAVQAQIGGGKAFVTTYRFGEYGGDPYATHLLDAIIRYTSGPGFAPRLKLQ